MSLDDCFTEIALLCYDRTSLSTAVSKSSVIGTDGVSRRHAPTIIVVAAAATDVATTTAAAGALMVVRLSVGLVVGVPLGAKLHEYSVSR